MALWVCTLVALVAGCAAAMGGWYVVLLVCLCVGILLLTVSALLLSGDRRQGLEREADLQRQLREEREGSERALAAVREEAESKCRQEMDHFRSNLSHSVRVPLSIVQGYAELLCGDLVADEAGRREYLEKIVQRSKYISSVLGQQLSEARTEETLNLSCVKLDLLEMIRQAAKDFQTTAEPHGITIQVISGEDAVYVWADPYQLTKVFFNLVENSVKYMGREGIISVRLTRQGDNAQIVVKDDGLGLSAEETKHIFELNYQGSNRTRGRGHGHGLYLTRKIIQAHGGTITAQSSPGQGMGIFITLPLLDCPEQPAPATTASPAEEDQTSVPA